jgi:apolipoprotein N-acyltransferase
MKDGSSAAGSGAASGEKDKSSNVAKPTRTVMLAECGLALLSALLLSLAFPDCDLWPLAWVALIPLLITLARHPGRRRAFLLGWMMGSVFFYSTCYWLTYSIIHYGRLSAPLAYSLLIPGALILGLFPAAFAMSLTQTVRRWGTSALLVAPFFWVALEWARLSITGQLWNAIGYSQAYHPSLIQTARWGGVYAVGFLIVAVSSSVSIALVKRSPRAIVLAVITVGIAAGIVMVSNRDSTRLLSHSRPELPDAMIIAVQPNVPMDFDKPAEAMRELLNRHIAESEKALDGLKDAAIPRLVIWPESPMNFAYGDDAQLRDQLASFTRRNHASLLFNSQESAPDKGSYNSALLVNEQGSLVAQYDKIRLMPFGEYVPLPAWLPGSSQVRAMVGGFTPGDRYTLMPLGHGQAGVFICIESAYPAIARTFASAGATVLINISNDGYLGPTPVMKQHLANVIFRAVENGRPVFRVTNTGTTAYITPRGEVHDPTNGFQIATRTWAVTTSTNVDTFYTRHGDLFAASCAVISLLLIALSIYSRPAI